MIELWFEPIAIITFFVLLAACLFMFLQFYICDGHTCKVFNDAADTAPEGTKEYIIALLNGLCNDGIWSIPYIGATILTPISLWILGVPITVKNFAILFLISFLVIYFLFAFFGHHYIKIVARYTANYVANNCPTVATAGKDSNMQVDEMTICERDENEDLPPEKFSFKSFAEGIGVTFAPPVTTF